MHKGITIDQTIRGERVMIKANELRHCNYYHFTGNSEGLFDFSNKPGRVMLNDVYGFYVEFDGISNEMLSYFSQEQISPIPLTPEILEKCGFENIQLPDLCEKETWMSNGLKIYKVAFYGTDNFGNNECFAYPRQNKGQWQSIRHLHELQNLYFALFTEELTINL